MYDFFIDKILDARANKTRIDDSVCSSFFDISLDDAYMVQKKISIKMRNEIFGWKLGGTNSVSRDATGVNEVFWGPLYDRNVFNTSAGLKDPLLLGAEVEIALRLSENFNEIDLSDLNENNCGVLFSQVALAIELPCSVVISGGAAVIADLCASGYAVLSKPIEYKEYASSDLSFDVYLNDKLLSTGGENYLCGSVEALTFEFLKSSSVKGFPVTSGQWILTGGLSPLIKMNDGDLLLVKSNLFDSICFEIE